MATDTRLAIANLTDLRPLIAAAHGFADVRAALLAGNSAGIDGAWGSACALSIATLAKSHTGATGGSSASVISTHNRNGGRAASGTPSTILVVLPRIADVDEFALDVANFLGQTAEVFPAWDALPQERTVNDAVFGGRLRVLELLGIANGAGARRRSPDLAETADRRSPELPVDAQSGDLRSKEVRGPETRAQRGGPQVIVTSMAALLQAVPSRAARRSATRTLTVGDELDRDAFLRWLVDCGFERTGGVEVPGEFCVHGGILDVYPPDAEDPCRIEFFGDEIESIRRFDAETQRKVADVTTATFTLVAPPGDDETADGGESLFDSLPANSWVVLTELEELIDEGNHYLGRLADPRGLFSVQSVMEKAASFPHAMISAVAASHETACHLQVESIERFSGPKATVLEELARVVGNDEQVLIACHNDGERQRLSELLAEYGPPLAERVSLCLGQIARGFRLVADRTLVLGDHELFGRRDLRRVTRRKRKLETRAIDSFLDLRPGDLVVHLTHGIGRYRGMKLLDKAKQQEEHLVIEFRDKVQVYVPVSLIHLVQKYVGAAKAVPTLSKLGGTAWSKRKKRVAEAVSDMAADMIRLQAARESRPGKAYPPDSHYQDEFEASFPYTETDDQVLAIADVKTDMIRPRPMDRLICGDVGYGKTEVAMRAAFKAVDAGKQVAVLVPTTVLAEQHYRTFTERMAEYPVNIDVISRFRSKGEQRELLEAARTGGVDILIGTHRLVQKDVQFKDLGLLVIDEEQRFGVDAKEMLKRMRLEVEVLTLSATPIPRTLHMSLLGVRDISNLTTAPQDRQAVETRICRFDGELIRRAVIRELNRNGQVYFVHNRVYNIQSIADRVQALVPEARIGIGHGQMPESQLESAMYDFVSGRTDILVCTTIIESGLDIPNANTIFINQANIFGLADLHQLRGRVGRYKHRAYCYLLLDENKPATPAATKRLKAIEEYSELGAGFKIAMRDLEIRGAGNILGTEQSGHISAVGYELYCQLLENAVRKLKDQPPREIHHVHVDLPISAFIPDDYLPPGRQKIQMYRKLSLAGSAEELADFAAELEDRFGPVPEPARRLLCVRELQLAAARWKIDEIRLEDGYAVFAFRNQDGLRALKQQSSADLRAVDSRTIFSPLPRDIEGDALIEHLKTLVCS